MRTSTSANGRPQLPCLAVGQVAVEAVAAVRTERLGHAEQAGRGGPGAAGGKDRLRGFRAAARRGRRSANPGSRGERGGLVGPAAEQRDPLAFEELQRARRLGLRLADQRRAGDERRQQAGAEAADPEERHRDVEAVVAA